MNAEAIAALDDPALTVPRVLDVHGTLTRLGFTYWPEVKIARRYGQGAFYRLFVKLFHPVDPPIIQRERKISHAEFVATCNDEDDLMLRVSFGYPERYKKKLKIIENFQKMLSDSIHERISLHNHDDRLRNLEARLKQLIERLATKRVDCTVEKDSKTGLVTVTIPEHEALRQVVHNAIDCHSPSQPQQDWWLEPEERPQKQTGIYEPELRRRIYRPSWDRRQVGRHRNVRRGI